ncbi:putative cellulase [Arabidopsis thaliana]
MNLAGTTNSQASEFYNGENDLEKFKTDVESFVCALMPGSSFQQVKPTPGKFSRLISYKFLFCSPFGVGFMVTFICIFCLFRWHFVN